MKLKVFGLDQLKLRFFFAFIKVGHENVKFVDFNEVVPLKSFPNAVCNKLSTYLMSF